MNTLPAMSRDLIAALNEAFPARCVRPGESMEDAHRYAGRRDVVEFLISLLDRQDRRADHTILE